MTGNNPKFSIIIPYRRKTKYLNECLKCIKEQTYKNYEVILLPGSLGPAEKRDKGGKKSTGDILAFIDDDTKPDKEWLAHALKIFRDKKVAGVGGPGVTPPGVSFYEEASGWVSSSPLGSGGFSYRFLPEEKRFVDDYPSMNLLVRKKDFFAVSGFDSSFWPGEDTKLCLDLVYKLHKKIVYDPEVLVYHHRRPLWLSHLAQNGNFGLHRGYFARVLPKTSFRLVYFLPSFLLIALILLPKVLIPAYGLLLAVNGLWVTVKSGSLFHGLISIPAVFLTHLWYGIRFIQGFVFTGSLVS